MKIGLEIVSWTLALATITLTDLFQSSERLYIKLVPAFPFLVLAIWIRLSRQADRPHVIGLAAAFLASLAAVALPLGRYWYDSTTHWRGGADIGLGILYMSLPVYSTMVMAAAYFVVRKRSMRHV